MSFAHDLALVADAAGLEGEALAVARAAVVRTDDARPVVVVAGGTGSGKSSLVNRLAGVDVTAVGELRPTTSEVVAAVPDGADEAASVLDRLGVLQRTSVGGSGPVLLDLPDLDSVVGGHRDLAEAAIAVADAIVWVLDPEKYADAVVHETMAAFAETPSLVVLGHADRLSGPDRLAVLDDVRRLVGDRRVFAVSVAPGEDAVGVDDLRAAIADIEVTPLDHATAVVARAALDGVGDPLVPGAGEAWASIEGAAAAAVDDAAAAAAERLGTAGRRQALMGRFDAPREPVGAPELDPPADWDREAPLAVLALWGWDRAATELAEAAEHAQLIAARAAVRSPGWWPWVRWGTLLVSALLAGAAVASLVVPDLLPVDWWWPAIAAVVVVVVGFVVLDRSGRAAGAVAARTARADAGRLLAGVRSGPGITGQRDRCAAVDDVVEARARVSALSGLGPIP